jgi:hypothetical protein
VDIDPGVFAALVERVTALADMITALAERVERMTEIDAIMRRAGMPGPVRAAAERQAARRARPRHLRVAGGGRDRT